MGDPRNACKILVGTRDHFEDLSVDGRVLKWILKI
jgi:hypothetical protein